MRRGSIRAEIPAPERVSGRPGSVARFGRQACPEHIPPRRERQRKLGGCADEREHLSPGGNLVGEGILAAAEPDRLGVRHPANAGKLREETIEALQERAAVLVARGREHGEATVGDARDGIHLPYVLAKRLRELFLDGLSPWRSVPVHEPLEALDRA